MRMSGRDVDRTHFSSLKMADMGRARLLYFIVNEFMDDENNDQILQRKEALRNNGVLACASLRLDYVPRVYNYMGTVVRQMGIPEHIDDFRVHYRVTRHLFDILLEITYPQLLSTGNGPKENVTPEKKLLISLCYLANTQSMREVAHTFNLSMSTVHGIIRQTYDVIAQLGSQVIRWPNPQQQVDLARNVEEECGLPGAIGFLDGCHVRLGDRDYYNRKGYPSMHLQAVVDHEMKIIHAHTGWPGCVHDARVLRNSSLFAEAKAGQLFIPNHYIMADSA